MFTLTSRKLSRAALVAFTVVGAGAAFLTASADPALALCKYGGPHCVNPNPGPKLPSVGGVKIPDSGWVDPDCKYYGNCNSSEIKARAAGKPKPGLGTIKPQSSGTAVKMQSLGGSPRLQSMGAPARMSMGASMGRRR